MVTKILKRVRGFSPVELVIMVGFSALAAAALIYLGTTPHYIASSTQPVNVNVKVDGSGATVSRTTSAKAEDDYEIGNVWSVPGDFNTIQEAVDASNSDGGDVIMVAPGTYKGATINVPVEIIGGDGVIINDGPKVDWAGSTYTTAFYLPPGHYGDGAKISNFTITDLEFPIFARGADNIVVSHLTITGCHLGIFNGGGSEWEITHNKMSNFSTAPYAVGHKVGIFIRGTSDYEPQSRTENIAQNNLIAFNDIDINMTSASYEPLSAGVLFMVYPFSMGTPGPIQNNKIVHNTIKVNGGTQQPPYTSASFVDSDVPLAFPPPFGDGKSRISGNYIGFNDFRGSEVGLGFFPPPIINFETISRNLGDNRAILSPNDAPEEVWKFTPIK